MVTPFESEKYKPVESTITQTTSESKTAKQEISEGPLLGPSINDFSKFVWLITETWKDASFSHWSSKNNKTEKQDNELTF